MRIRSQALAELEFVHTHDVPIKNGMPNFRKQRGASKAASVYMWVSPTEVADEFEVLYIGKAGYGIQRRLQQHRGGFVNSGTGKQNRALITDWIAQGRKVMVFGRVSATHLIFGTRVSLYSAEEHALCDRFMPRWNRARFPQAAAVQAMPLELAPRLPDLPAFSEVADGDEVAAFYGSLPAGKQVQFAQLVALIERRDPAAGQKVIGGYSRQPRGYSAKPMLVFGTIGAGGNAMNAVGRIPLVDSEDCPLTVTFLRSDQVPGLDTKLISAGSSGTWRPLDLADFLANPHTYLANP